MRLLRDIAIAVGIMLATFALFGAGLVIGGRIGDAVVSALK